MGIELILGRFGTEVDARGLSAMKSAAADVLKQFNRSRNLLVDGADGAFQVLLDGGAINVHADHATVPVPKLDRLTCGVVYAIAKAGDLVAVTEGGKYPVVLVDERQRAQLPDESWQDPGQSPVAEDAVALQKLLRSWHRVHKVFAEKVFADRAIKTGETSAEKATPTPPSPTVVLPPAVWTYDVYLYRLSRNAYREPKHETVLDDHFRHLDGVSDDGCKITRRYESLAWFDVPGGSGRVWSSKAYFDLTEVDPVTCQIIWDLARIGDMAVVTHKPRGFQTILTHPDQRRNLPKPWRTDEAFLSLCDSSEEMAAVLRRHTEIDLPPEKRALFGPEVPIPLPDTGPSLSDTIYLEMMPRDEKGEKQHKRLTRFLQPRLRAIYARHPGWWGMMNCDFRLVATPDHKKFNSYSYSHIGSEDYFQLALRDFATEEGILTARVINFEIFAQSDGKTFGIDECRELA